MAEMIATTDTDEFLAHFGVKGMKWGVRHVVGANGRVTGSTAGRSSGGSSGGSGGGGDSTQRPSGLSRNQKIAIGVGVGAAIALGAAAVAYKMKTGGKLPLSALKKGKAAASTNHGEVLADLIIKSKANQQKRQWTPNGEVFSKIKKRTGFAKPKNGRFDTLGDIIAKSAAKQKQRSAKWTPSDQVFSKIKKRTGFSTPKNGRFDTLGDIIAKEKKRQANWTPADQVFAKIKKRTGF